MAPSRWPGLGRMLKTTQFWHNVLAGQVGNLLVAIIAYILNGWPLEEIFVGLISSRLFMAVFLIITFGSITRGLVRAYGENALTLFDMLVHVADIANEAINLDSGRDFRDFVLARVETALGPKEAFAIILKLDNNDLKVIRESPQAAGRFGEFKVSNWPKAMCVIARSFRDDDMQWASPHDGTSKIDPKLASLLGDKHDEVVIATPISSSGTSARKFGVLVVMLGRKKTEGDLSFLETVSRIVVKHALGINSSLF